MRISDWSSDVCSSDLDARQSAPGTAIIVSMLRALALTVLIAPIPMAAPSDAAGGHDSGLVAWVTVCDTFRLESGERISIAGINPPEHNRHKPNCPGKTPLDLRATSYSTSPHPRPEGTHPHTAP